MRKPEPPPSRYVYERVSPTLIGICLFIMLWGGVLIGDSLYALYCTFTGN